jgi:hypothetical protein
MRINRTDTALASIGLTAAYAYAKAGTAVALTTALVTLVAFYAIHDIVVRSALGKGSHRCGISCGLASSAIAASISLYALHALGLLTTTPSGCLAIGIFGVGAHLLLRYRQSPILRFPPVTPPNPQPLDDPFLEQVNNLKNQLKIKFANLPTAHSAHFKEGQDPNVHVYLNDTILKRQVDQEQFEASLPAAAMTEVVGVGIRMPTSQMEELSLLEKSDDLEITSNGECVSITQNPDSPLSNLFYELRKLLPESIDGSEIDLKVRGIIRYLLPNESVSDLLALLENEIEDLPNSNLIIIDNASKINFTSNKDGIAIFRIHKIYVGNIYLGRMLITRFVHFEDTEFSAGNMNTFLSFMFSKV